MDKTKIANLIGAGSMTTLMITLALLFGGGWGTADASGGTTTVTEQPALVVPVDNADPLQQQNQQLQDALQLMQEREAIYQSQLDEANAALTAQSNASYGGEYEEHEHEEYEEDEDEYEDEDDD